MRNILCLLLAAWQSVAFAQGVERITDENIPFAYESRAQIPTSQDALAKLVSIEYRRAKDEFTRHDLMQKIEPVLKDKLENAKNTKNYIIRVGTKLGEYDFEKQVFPSGFSESTFVLFENGYAVTFENSKSIEFIPMNIEKAKALSGSLQRSRNITAVMHVSVTKAKEQNLDWNHHKALVTQIDKVEYLSQKGEVLAVIQL